MTFLRKKHRIRPLQAGFTLIELLIVVVILAILAAIVVFAVGGSRANALASSCKADAKSLETALEAWKANNGNGSYPTPPTSPTDTASSSAGWGALPPAGAPAPGGATRRSLRLAWRNAVARALPSRWL